MGRETKDCSMSKLRIVDQENDRVEIAIDHEDREVGRAVVQLTDDGIVVDVYAPELPEDEQLVTSTYAFYGEFS